LSRFNGQVNIHDYLEIKIGKKAIVVHKNPNDIIYILVILLEFFFHSHSTKDAIVFYEGKKGKKTGHGFRI
jgi:hypothetical protein